MRVLQVVTQSSKSGSYGGPFSVAVSQCAELEDQGHQVVLLAAHETHDAVVDTPTFLEQYPAIPVPASRPSTLMSPRLWARFRALEPWADVVHLHLGREPIPVAAGLMSTGTPLVAQTHGMVIPDIRRTVLAFDRTILRRALHNVRVLLALQPEEAGMLREVIGRLHLHTEPQIHLLPNGVAPPDGQHRAHWSPNPEILYLGRIHKKKNPVALVRLAENSQHSLPHAVFKIVGPDGGISKELQTAIRDKRLEHRITVEGPVPGSRTAARIAQAQILVLPRVIGESFGLSALEAMQVGVPPIVMERSGLAHYIAGSLPNSVAANDGNDLQAKVESLLASEAAWVEASETGRKVCRHLFAIKSVVEQLVDVYARAIHSSF